MGQGHGEFQPIQQLCQRFALSAFQHGQVGFSLVSDGDAFFDRRNNPDGDFLLCDCLFNVGQACVDATVITEARQCFLPF